MTNNAVVVFRADAGPNIGAGHVARCLTLAHEMHRWGWTVKFATNPDAATTVPALKRSGFGIIEMSDTAEEPAAIRAAVGSARLMVVDHYNRDISFESSCQSFVDQVVAIDDLADRSHACDLLVDATADRDRQSYLPLTPPGSSLLLGARYAFINEVFRAARPASLLRRQTSPSISRILVSLGATDPANATSQVLKALAASGFAGDIDVVMGPSAPFLESVRQQIGSMPATTLHVNPGNMAELVSRADFAIGASGTSAWERMTLGVPALLLVTASNQRASADAFRRLGLAEVFEVGAEDLAARISRLLAQPHLLWKQGQSAADACDGQGVHRVFCQLSGSVRLPSGATAKLRAASLADSDLLHEWRSDPDTVRASLTPRAPTREEHDRWIATRLARLTHPFAVVLLNDKPAGVVRLEPRGSDWEVSITIAPVFRGSGVGKAALHLIRRLCPAATIYATIRPENAASRRIFAAAGYEPTDQATVLVSYPAAT